MKIEGRKNPIMQPRGVMAVMILIQRADSLDANQTAAILAGAFAKQNAIPPIMEPISAK